MRKEALGAAFFVSFLLTSAPLPAQDAPSLGELARKERERKKAQAQTPESNPELNKLSPEEKAGYLSLGFILAEEGLCKESLGKYVSWEGLFEGCRSKGVEISIKREDDPRHDANYEYRLNAQTNTLEVFLIPRRAGLAGYFSDGQKIYFNPQGAATRESKVVYDLSRPSSPSPAAGGAGPAASQSPKSSAGGKVWTGDDLRQLKGSVNSSGNEPSEAAAPSPPPAGSEAARLFGETPQEMEEMAYEYLGTIHWVEFHCHWNLHKYFSLEEIVKGVEIGPGKIEGFLPGKDPRLDPHYKFIVETSEDKLRIWANPRRPGLGGYYYDGNKIHYNQNGAASESDKLLPSGVIPMHYGLVRRND